jgi:hypothetical protein
MLHAAGRGLAHPFSVISDPFTTEAAPPFAALFEDSLFPVKQFFSLWRGAGEPLSI